MTDNSEAMISKADVLRIIDLHFSKPYKKIRTIRNGDGVYRDYHAMSYGEYEAMIAEIESLG